MYPTRPPMPQMSQQAQRPQMPMQAFGGMQPQMGGMPSLTMPTQAQGTPMGLPFNGGMRPSMPQGQTPPQAFGGQGILSQELPQFPQAPRMNIPPDQLARILQMLSQRRA